MPSQVLTVLRKEILDATRDLKSLAPGLMMPLIFAVMTYGMVHFLVNVQDQPPSFELAVQGAERAQPLMNALREGGIDIVEAPENPADAVRARLVDMVLVIPENFNEQFRNQKRANVDLVWDISRTDAHGRVNRIKSHIQQWAGTTGSLRLLLRGVSPEVSQVVGVQDVNVASDERMASRLFAGLPMVVLLLAFVSGAGMASEMAAGERENRTLEPLLITPVSLPRLFCGKWLAAVAVTLVFAFLGVALQLYAIAAAPLEKLGFRTSLDAGDFALVMLILMPVIFLATAVQLFVSFLSKSFKDAQIYNQLLVLLPVIPGIYILLADAGVEGWKLWVPLLGPQMLVAEIFAGQSVSMLSVVIVSCSSFILAVVFAALGTRLMGKT